jgi:hypothetical protein
MWFALMLLACTDDPVSGDSDLSSGSDTEDVSETDPDPSGIAIAGSWIDNYGYDHVITDSAWESYDSSAPVALTQYDNAEAWTVGQNHPDDFFPNQWSRFEWFEETSGQLWYCQIAFDEDSEDAALAVVAADSSDVAMAGCGGSPWSQLNAAR